MVSGIASIASIVSIGADFGAHSGGVIYTVGFVVHCNTPHA